MNIASQCTTLNTLLGRIEQGADDSTLRDEARDVFHAISARVESADASAQKQAYRTLMRYHDVNQNPRGKLDCYHRLKALGQY